MSGTGTASRPDRGLFQNSIWHCDCRPRLPAEHFQTKKQNHNYGRWFYTCQKPQGQGCGMFLWEDDALPRERSAVLANSHTEPTPRKDDTEKGYETGYETAPERQTAAGKRRMPWMTEATTNNEHPASGSATAHDIKATEAGPSTSSAAGRTNMPAPQTPQKTEKFRSVNGLPTPNTSPQDKQNGPAANNQDTPTPLRFRDAIAPDTPSPAKPESLATAAIAILKRKRIHLGPDTEAELRGLLTKHELQKKGVERGREATRTALADRERKITELHNHIARLETEREADRARVAELKGDLDREKAALERQMIVNKNLHLNMEKRKVR